MQFLFILGTVDRVTHCFANENLVFAFKKIHSEYIQEKQILLTTFVLLI